MAKHISTTLTFCVLYLSCLAVQAQTGTPFRIASYDSGGVLGSSFTGATDATGNPLTLEGAFDAPESMHSFYAVHYQDQTYFQGTLNIINDGLVSAGGRIVMDPSDPANDGWGYLGNGYQINATFTPPNVLVEDYRLGGDLRTFFDSPSAQDICIHNLTTSNLRPCGSQTLASNVTGYAYGNPGEYASANDYVENGFSVSYNSWAKANHIPWSLTGFNFGTGDVNVMDVQYGVKPGSVGGSQEGVRFMQGRAYEIPPYQGFVLTTGTGNTPSISCLANCDYEGPGHPFVDLNYDVLTGTVTYTGAPPIDEDPNDVPAVFTTSFTVPVSIVASLASAVSVAVDPSNNNPVPTTFTVNTPTAFSVGDLIALNGFANIENAKVTAVGALSSGQQSVTASLLYSHSAGAQVCDGGMVGRYLELTAYTHSYNGSVYRYVQPVLCSTSSNTIEAGALSTGNIYGYGEYPGSAQAAAIYHGAEVIGVIDPTRGRASGYYVRLADNDVTWTAGDTVENDNYISASYALVHYDFSGIYNPFAGYSTFEVDMPNGLNGPSGSLFSIFNRGGGHDTGFTWTGELASFFVGDYAPDSSPPEVGGGTVGCVFCFRKSTAPQTHIFYMLDTQAAIDYYTASGFKIVGSTQIAGALTASSLAAFDTNGDATASVISWSGLSGLTIGSPSTLSIYFDYAASISQFHRAGIFAGPLDVANGYGGILNLGAEQNFNSNDTPLTVLGLSGGGNCAYFFMGSANTCPPNTLQIGGALSVTGLSSLNSVTVSRFLNVYNTATFHNQMNSVASAGNPASVLVPSDDGDVTKLIYGANNANSAYVWWITNAGSGVFPVLRGTSATAPSGSCSNIGDVVLSQDGHASHCTAGSWVEAW